MAIRLQRSALTRLGLHLLGIVALMWPALINGQPFFFSDTTAYVRAADLAVQIGSGQRIHTAWSRIDPAPPATPPGPNLAPPAPLSAEIAHGSDGRNGTSVMAGRSPYFGMLLYIAYVLSNFWLFVIGQAIVAWWLIGLALRCFGSRSLPFRLGVTALLALTTPLAIYASLLLADALAGFGILAFLILVRPPYDLRRWEVPALVAVMAISSAAHLTHIVMFAGMAGLLGLIMALRSASRQRGPLSLAVGLGVVLVGLLSVSVTAVVVKKALGRAPAAAPVMTARVVVDGPGREFIAKGCGGQDFAACRMPTVATNSDIWLWSRDPREGGFLTADAPTRTALSIQDRHFAEAVLMAYPVREGGMMALNSGRQLTSFDSGILNESCFVDYGCSQIDVPDAVRAKMRTTPGGRGIWPSGALATLHVLTVIAALVTLAFATRTLLASQPQCANHLLLWLALLGTAILINAFLGGAISNPQARYQERIIWLLPLMALLAGTRAWGAIGSLPAPSGNR